MFIFILVLQTPYIAIAAAVPQLPSLIRELLGITDQKVSDSIQDLNGAMPASKLGEVSGTVLDVVQARSLGGATGS